MRRSVGGALVVSSILVAGGGVAQAADTLRVTLPFAFGAGDTEFPKGSCTIDISEATRVSIQCSRVRAVAQVQSIPFVGSVYEVAERKEMLFTRYGDTYFSPRSGSRTRVASSSSRARRRRSPTAASKPPRSS